MSDKIEVKADTPHKGGVVMFYRRMFLTIWAVILTVWCGAVGMEMASAQSRAPKLHYVDIELNAGSCPIAVSPDPLTLSKGDRVEWQSVTVIGGVWSVVPKRYTILFDPFAGGVFSSDPSGLARSTPTRSDLPDEPVTYKYTVVSDDDSGCPPLDPRIRVGRG
ncbi:hypothetical protein LCGC14_2838700 [marine sediment metagenome]|uniref:Uncharacterized protein n=1 Tax=marine sediment metagenome TaxID=412755 RepID=A0A0F8YC40_9ZZZZ